MKKEKPETLSPFSISILIGILCATLLSLIVALIFDPFFVLNENQLLYVFSSMAQIIGGVFGLTLTAYVFFVDKFKESTQGDDTYYDATSSLLRRFFQTLALIATACGLTILLSILGIISLHNWTTVYPFIINESVLLFVLSLVSILLFGVMLLDPDKLEKEIKRQVEAVREQKATNRLGDFTDFLGNYNSLQEVLIEFASRLVYSKEVSPQDFRKYKPQIIQALKVLNGKQIINYSLLAEIDELRMYRNALVHGVDFTVSQDVCDRIEEIYSTIKNAYEVYLKEGTNSKQWEESIKKVYNLTNQDTTF